MLQLIRNFLEPFFKYKNATFSVEQEKVIHYLCVGEIGKSIPRDLRLSSLGKLRDAKQ